MISIQKIIRWILRNQNFELFGFIFRQHGQARIIAVMLFVLVNAYLLNTSTAFAGADTVINESNRKDSAIIVRETFRGGMSGVKSVAPAAGNGSAGSPYEISTIENLYWIADDHTRWGYHYIQTANIDASGTEFLFEGAGWQPVGNSINPFTGTYNGQGYIISDLHINRSASNEIGLFGSIDGQSTQPVELRNITLLNVSVTGFRQVGALVGRAEQFNTITNCHVSGTVNGNRNTGGLVGWGLRTDFVRCSSAADVALNGTSGALYHGGLIGHINTASTVVESFATGNVSGRGRVGGLIGAIGWNSTVENCYAKGTVESIIPNPMIGGLIGEVWNAGVKNSYSTGYINMNNITSEFGGLVGNKATDSNFFDENNFWDTETSGAITSTMGTGKTTSEMKLAETFTDTNTSGLDEPWDFDSAWAIDVDTNNGYPYLKNNPPLCKNPESGGIISPNHITCAGDTPQPFISNSAATGHFGELEYQWQISVSSPTFTDITGANSENYTHTDVINLTTWFRRLARVTCDPVEWNNAVASNVIQVSVLTQPVVTDISIEPDLDVTFFSNYQLSANIEPNENTINDVSFIIRPQTAGETNPNWDFLTNGTPYPNPNEPFLRTANSTDGNTWSFDQLFPDDIYPEIGFIFDIDEEPSDSRFWRDSYHLMHFTNPFTMSANTSFFIEMYATPKTTAPFSVDMQVFLVGKGFNITAFESGGALANEAWRTHQDVELVGTISQDSDFHHTHSPFSKHFLIPLSTNEQGKIGNKEIDINDDFWIILTTGHQLQTRGWDLKYHAGCNNNNTWYKGSGTSFSVQTGCPDVHVHFAKEQPLEPYNSLEIYVEVAYEQNGTVCTSQSTPNQFYFSELPNLPPNPGAFILPEPGNYQGNVTISWFPATDPNNDPITYNIFLVGSTATYTLATDYTDTSFLLNTLNYPNGDYDIIVEACDAEFCTPFAWSSSISFDEGEDDFFRILNAPPPPIANDDEFCINGLVTLDVLENDEFDDYYESPGSVTITITVQPVAGSATVNPDGSIEFDPEGGTAMTENQVVTFTYRVFDPDFPGVFDEAIVTVRYLSEILPPVANDVAITTTTELATVIDVLANDTDPQGFQLSVESIVSGPSSGSAVINPDHTITYTPFAGFEGTDSFVYEVCNEGCGTLGTECATATVTITVIFAYYVCADGTSTISVDPVPGATGYVWTLPLGSNPLVGTVSETTPAVIVNTDGPTIEVDWSGVASGQYEVCVEPTNDCGPGTEQCIELVVSDLEIIAAESSVTCFGENNGSIGLTIEGGIAPYSFVWTKDGAPTSLNIQNPGGLAPGIYEVTVTDKYGCVATSDPITILEPPAAISITLDPPIVNESAPDQEDGAISITVDGGTGDYSFSWTKSGDPGFAASTQNVENLSGGTYTVLVTDENGCTAEASFTVDQIGGLLQVSAIIATDVLCHGDATGTINLEMIGGSGSYTYSWTASDGGVVPGGQENNQDLTGLVAGTYQVIVNDGTDTVIESVIVSEPASALAVTATASDITCHGANDGSIILSVSGGTAPYSYLWDNGATSQNLGSLSEGSYLVTVTDANGCFVTVSREITEPLELVVNGTITNSSCDNGSSGAIDLSVSGGSEPYSYSWVGSNGFTSDQEDINNLEPGVYSVIVTDDEGCVAGRSFTVRNTCIEVEKTLLSGPGNNGNGTYNLTYQVAVRNTGNTSLFEVQVEEDLSATYSNFHNVSISSTKFATNIGFDGEAVTELLNAGQTLAPGEEGRINISLTVTPGIFNNPYENTVEASAQDADEVTTSDTDTQDVTFTENPVIGVAKAVTSGPTINPDGSYDLSFTITVRNFGDVPLVDVQVTDDLDDTFGAGTYAVNDVTASSGFTVNDDFDGSTDQNLLSSSTPMAINEIRTIVISLNVTPTTDDDFENQATATAEGPGGTPTNDDSHDGLNPDPGNEGNPNDFNDPTPINFPENPEIGLAKRLSAGPVNNNDGSYTLTYEIRVKNTGDVILYDIQVTDNLENTFDGSPVTAGVSSADFTVNTSYDGTSDIHLLASAGNVLEVDETKFITLEVTVTPGDKLGTYTNTAQASGTSAFGSTVTDTSNNGIDVNPDNTHPNNHTTPTPVEFDEAPAMELVKAVSSVSNNQDGTYDVTYTIEVRNTGDVPLVNVQVTDDLTDTFAGAVTYDVQNITASGTLVANTVADFNTTNHLLIATSSSVAFNTTEIITLVVRVTPGTKLGIYNNQAFGTATGPGGTPAEDDTNIVPVTFTEDPSLLVAKSILDDDISDDGEENFTFTYEIRVENTGNVPLNNLQVVDELAVAFADASNSFTVNSALVHTQPASTVLTSNAAYNGDSDANLLDETEDQDLSVGEFAVIRINLTVSFEPTDPAGPYTNEAFAFGLTPGGRFTSNLDDDLVTFDFEDPQLQLIKTLENIVDSSAETGQETQRVTFRLEIRNLGNVNLIDLEIFDNIVGQFAGLNPQNFEAEEGLSLFVNPNWDGTAGSNILAEGQFFDDEIEDDYFVFISFDVTPGPTLATLNIATANGTTPLDTTVNDTDNANVVYLQPDPEGADLAIEKTVDPDDDIWTGDQITFTITVTNHGPADATDVIVTEKIPSGFTYVNHTVSNGNFDHENGIWDIGNLDLNETATLTITVTVKSDGDYRNNVSVRANETDPNLFNNYDSLEVEVKCPIRNLTPQLNQN